MEKIPFQTSYFGGLDSPVARPCDLLPGVTRIAVAMGVFDGVHLGHQAIIRSLVEAAARTNAVPVALFFNPHPRAVVFPPAPLCLTGLEHKASLLLACGARRLVCMNFTREMSRLAPHEFLDNYFHVPGLTVTVFCVGDNWRFGKGNGGGSESLNSWAAAHGAASCIVPAVSRNGSVISSTRIRGEIESGNLAEAEAMLGRKFAISGIVRHGYGIGGTTLKYPTANICEPNHILPPFGVYAARAKWGGRIADGIVYVGAAPTIRQGEHPEVWVELHLFEVHENLYDKEMLVEFHGYIRPSVKFKTPEALGTQIGKDIEKAKIILGTGV